MSDQEIDWDALAKAGHRAMYFDGPPEGEGDAERQREGPRRFARAVVLAYVEQRSAQGFVEIPRSVILAHEAARDRLVDCHDAHGDDLLACMNEEEDCSVAADRIADYALD